MPGRCSRRTADRKPRRLGWRRSSRRADPPRPTLQRPVPPARWPCRGTTFPRGPKASVEARPLWCVSRPIGGCPAPESRQASRNQGQARPRRRSAPCRPARHNGETGRRPDPGRRPTWAGVLATRAPMLPRRGAPARSTKPQRASSRAPKRRRRCPVCSLSGANKRRVCAPAAIDHWTASRRPFHGRHKRKPRRTL